MPPSNVTPDLIRGKADMLVCAECGEEQHEVDCATELCLSCFDLIFSDSPETDFQP